MERDNELYYTNLLNDDLHIYDEYANVAATLSQSNTSELNTQRKPRTRNFSTQEDLMLVSAWLNISTDATHSNNQTKQRYWERIHAYFNQYKEFESDRNPNSLMHRWSIIQLAVSKFSRYYNQIDDRNQSGTTEQNKVISIVI